MGLLAGVAKIDITPPLGSPLGSFSVRPGPSQGIHDPLYAKVLALSTGDVGAIFITVDTVSIPTKIADIVRESIQGLTGVGKEAVLIAASHTHSEPETIGITADFDEPSIDTYLRVLEKSLTGLAHTSWRKLSPARLGSGKGEATIGHNRREKGGPIDTDVGVIRVDDDEETPRAAVVNYACHPVVLGPQNLLITADYPGYLNKILERAKGKGFTSLFMNGAAGNINPNSFKGWRDMQFAVPGTFRAAKSLGSIVAGEALKTMEQITTSSEVKIQASSETKCLQAPKVDIAKAEEQVKIRRKMLLEVIDKGAKHAEIAPYKAALNYSIRNLDHLKKETEKDREIIIEVQVIKIGDVALVAVPGELFVEIGREIKARSEVKNTFVVGYANGYIGYIPTLKAFKEGGYGPTRYFWNKATPKAETFIKESSLSQLAAMK